MMNSNPFVRREGPPFSLVDLKRALWWAQERPGLMLGVATDHPGAEEAIRIWPPGFDVQRWTVYRDQTGAIHVDDLYRGSFGRPYRTLADVLTHMSAILAEGYGDLGQQIRSAADRRRFF